MKAAKAAKEVITSEVNLLLDLKEKFKKATGAEWSPNVVVTMALASTEQPSKADNLSSKIVAQGDKVLSRVFCSMYEIYFTVRDIT